MSGCKYLNRNSSALLSSSLENSSLPASIPKWPEGEGFGTGRINLGEIVVRALTNFEFIWGSHLSHDKNKSVSFYKPVGIPEGYFCFGHYCQLNSNPLDGYVLVGKFSVQPVMETDDDDDDDSTSIERAAFIIPVDYKLIWVSDDGMGVFDPRGYFWLPVAPPGYKPLGFLVTNKNVKPDLDEVRCVREDLTDKCETCSALLETYSKFRKIPFKVEKVRSYDRGMHGRGVPIGTFFCSTPSSNGIQDLPISCLKNLDQTLYAMPNLDQIHALINHYGPTVFFHPDEIYLPCSISWFFQNGALLVRAGESGEPIDGEAISLDGSNLPSGGKNDGGFWIDLPGNYYQREIIKKGNLDSAEVYVHVKPALGGTFTDVVMWIFFPFNGPTTWKMGPTSMTMVGEHNGDWEHFTLRLSNFTGELDSIYYSQDNHGQWVKPWDLEFPVGNRAVVYSSRSGHACFSSPGTHVHGFGFGSSIMGVGVKNECAQSNFILDCSNQYKIIGAEYLREDVVVEPQWLQFMQRWGPKVVYDRRAVFDRIVARLPFLVQYSFESLLSRFPQQLFGEEGPTGPKEKQNWVGDEIW